MEKIKMLLTRREAKVIMVMRRLKYGKIEVDIRDSIPQPKVKQREKIIDLDKENFPQIDTLDRTFLEE